MADTPLPEVNPLAKTFPPNADLAAEIQRLSQGAIESKILTSDDFEKLKQQFGTETLYDQMQVAEYLGKLLSAKGQSIQNLANLIQAQSTGVELAAKSQNVGTLLSKYHLTADDMTPQSFADGSYFKKINQLLNDPMTTQIGVKAVMEAVTSAAAASSAPAKALAETAESIAKSELYTDLAAKGDKRTATEQQMFLALESAKGQAATQIVNAENYEELTKKDPKTLTFAEKTAITTYENLVAQTQTNTAQAQITQRSLAILKNFTTPDGNIDTSKVGSIAGSMMDATAKNIIPGLGGPGH